MGNRGGRTDSTHSPICAGTAHNESASALTFIYRTVVLANVNITNSSMHALTIVAPQSRVDMLRMNITDNHGLGANVISINVHAASAQTTCKTDEQRCMLITCPATHPSPLDFTTLPDHLPGLLDMCAVQRAVVVRSRLLVYYKYDSYPVDCVKWFTSINPARKVAFR